MWEVRKKTRRGEEMTIDPDAFSRATFQVALEKRENSEREEEMIQKGTTKT